MNDFRERLPLVLAIAVSVAWVGLVAIYLHGLGFYAVLQMPPVQLATLLGACGGPLAALWLVVAVFEHRRETKQLARRMGEMITLTRQTVQQSEVQARALLQVLGQASRAQSTEAREMALHELATNAAVLAERLGVITRDNINAAWARYGAGHETVFVQSFLAFAATHPELTERMAEAVTRAGTAQAAVVLCAKARPDGSFSSTVKIRTGACRANEQQLDPGPLGLQGPAGEQGPAGLATPLACSMRYFERGTLAPDACASYGEFCVVAMVEAGSRFPDDCFDPHVGQASAAVCCK